MSWWNRKRKIARVEHRLGVIEERLIQQGIVGGGKSFQPESIRGVTNYLLEERVKLNARIDMLLEHLNCKEVTTKAVKPRQKIVCKVRTKAKLRGK